MTELLSVWRPDLPDSNDGEPLATDITHFSPMHFPYDRLPTTSNGDQRFQWLAWLLRPEVVVICVCFYLYSDSTFDTLRKLIGLKPDSIGLRAFVAFHNLVLFLFSAACAWNSWAIVILHVTEHGAFNTYCDPHGTLWKSGLGAWSTIFYLSKYWEFIDTWILILKGKKDLFLQTYHHAGIVFCMYGGVASQSAWLLFVVLLNSVIHTLMYLYFFIKTVRPKTDIKSAKYLTMAQIGQFLTGIGSTLGVLWMGDACDTDSSRFSLFCLDVYGLGLIALFVGFAKKKYKKN